MRAGLLLVAMLVAGAVADSVQFLGADYTTRGNWKGVYGADGYRTALKAHRSGITWTDSIPSYATFSGWTPSTSREDDWPWLSNWEVSYPQHPTGSGRIGATAFYPYPDAYTQPGMWITLTVTGTRDVHLYSLDGHIGGGRRNTIRVRLGTAQSGTAAHTYAITTDMRPGVWTSYRISGTVTFEIAKAGQYDAVLSAFMFDTPEPAVCSKVHGIADVIKAGEYRCGGEGVGYHDATSGNIGGFGDRNDDVDMFDSGDGTPAIGWIDTNEYTVYTVNVPAAGNYNVEIRWANGGSSTGHMKFLLDGVDGGTLALEPTGGWGTFVTATKGPIALAATTGNGQLKLLALGFRQYNIYSVRFIAVTTPAPTPNPQICAGACLFTLCGTIDQIVAVTVTGTSGNLVWGTETFTDDSDVGAASVHAGKVAVGETKTVTVRCAGPKSSFVGSTANGITSKSYGPWGASFSFDLEGKEPASPPAPERCFHEPCALPKCVVQGTQFDMVVVGATRGDLVWGTHTYTTDSHLGTAAVHAGLLANGAEGAVTVVCTGAQSSYAGTEQNGVTTTGYGPWGFSMQLKAGPPTPPPSTAIVCKEACVVGRCTEGSSHRIRVAGLTYGYGWGSATYADDTHVGMAAVHAGVVTAGQTAEVLLTCTGAQSSFTGTTANGITTSSYGSWPASFTLAAAPTPTTAPCTGSCLLNLCAIQGKVHHLSITGTTGGSLWGTSIYSDDSSVPTAAVHAGLVAAGETKTLVATCTGPQETYEGSTSNQVTSNPFGYWAHSFALE